MSGESKLSSVVDEINDSWSSLKSSIDKHPKETFKFMFIEGKGWCIEINFDLLGLPKETTMSSLYKD